MVAAVATTRTSTRKPSLMTPTRSKLQVASGPKQVKLADDPTASVRRAQQAGPSLGDLWGTPSRWTAEMVEEAKAMPELLDAMIRIQANELVACQTMRSKAIEQGDIDQANRLNREYKQDKKEWHLMLKIKHSIKPEMANQPVRREPRSSDDSSEDSDDDESSVESSSEDGSYEDEASTDSSYDDGSDDDQTSVDSSSEDGSYDDEASTDSSYDDGSDVDEGSVDS